MAPHGWLREVDTPDRKGEADDFGSQEAAGTEDKAYELEVFDIEREIRENRDYPLSRTLPRVAERVRSLTHADGAAIALRDEWGVICRASTGNAPSLGSRLRPDSGLTRECFEKGQLVVCEDAEKDPRVRTSIAKGLHLGSAAAVPILAQSEVIGIIEVLSSRPCAFDSTHIARLQSIGELLVPLLATPRPQRNQRDAARRRRVALLGTVFALLVFLLFLLGELHRGRRIPSSATPSGAPHHGLESEIGKMRPGAVEAPTRGPDGRSPAELGPPAGFSPSEPLKLPMIGTCARHPRSRKLRPYLYLAIPACPRPGRAPNPRRQSNRSSRRFSRK